MTPIELRERWTYRRDDYARTHAMVSGEVIANDILNDLATLDKTIMDRPLTLKESADESGYSIDHLGWLVRRGRIPNAGHRHAPRIKREDLPPAKSRGVAGKRKRAYDVDADARSLRIPRR